MRMMPSMQSPLRTTRPIRYTVRYWWKNNQAPIQSVATLAARYFSIPASCAPAESVFSVAGMTWTAIRSSLSAVNGAALVMIHMNQKLIPSHARDEQVRRMSVCVR